ncbi:MAG: hypothetical protein ACFFDW_12775 [Candidatus Thorarchaeota archaeon]
MDLRVLLGKIAADKDSKKLGKIVRIERFLGKTIKKIKPYAIILVSKPFRKDFYVPIEVERITKIDIQYAWFNITKEEFENQLKQIKNEKLDREFFRGDTSVKPSQGRGVNFDPYNLGPSRKERKK